MRGLKMYVDNQLCHTIGDESYYTPPDDRRPVPIHVQCNTPLTGRYVTLVKNFTGTVDTTFHYEILSVCEVQVWATPPPTTTTTTTTIATTSTTTAPIIYPKTTPTARTAITAVPSGLTSKTSIAISNSSTMTRPKEDSPQNTSTDTLVTVIAGAFGAVVALLIAVIIVVFVVMRKKRSKTPDPGHSTANSAAHPADNKIAVMDDDVTTGGSVSVAEDHTTDNDTASTTDNVYEII
ncbi:probable maltase-glucoamylase 2, partial [Littorina saxatilis]|uniref:probable maltase-glucoamylase 2 n=1 Tax=Littorina saxatilis TaxID=31220 RepID=UPI0038B69B17